MESHYSPATIEDKWYQAWEGAGAFRPRGDGEPYTIVIPPPNVTGALHMGHALNNTLQDILIRWRRLQGRRTLWQPGTDHAGIATQSVVERQLAKEGKRRQDLGREAFVAKVWEWKAEYGDRIVQQLKKLGCSCDWSRLRFTMDEGLSRAVREVFVRLHADGLIYQGTRLINWDPTLLTAVADEEVESRDTQGHFWSIRYPLEKDPSRHIVVATTRPETLFGDAAVAVHPDDPRYRDLIGQRVRLPATDRTIPIIADIHADPEKGSGAVKITPAHDFNDFEVGQRHGLPLIVCMHPDATMNALAGPYEGLDRFECRKRLVERLKAEGLLDKVEDRIIPIPYCYRGGAVIEPYLKSQWFVNMRPLAEPALAAVAEGRTEFVPARYAKTYNAWLEPFKDWCISRQLWWGHRIPAWYAVSETGGQRTAATPVFVAKDEAAAYAQARAKHGDGVKLEQDEDVLDTWFSSALWPFSTLGWPDRTPELDAFYPTKVLVTARDIIYFWVARMMITGIKFLGKEPFRHVYIHGTILDEKGQRMSKSKGNGIDPIEMIGQFGADAVRFALATLTTEGQDIKLSPTKFEAGRNFANKLWNAVRFVHPHLEGNWAPLGDRKLEPADRWILSRLNALVKEVTDALENFRFAEAAQAIYRFTWDDFCSRYLEIRKAVITATEATPEKKVAVSVFREVLRQLIALLHPFMPFLTEEIRSHIGEEGLLATASWPEAEAKAIDPDLERAFENVFGIVEGIREIRGRYGIPFSTKLSPTVAYEAAAHTALTQAGYLELADSMAKSLGGLDVVTIGMEANTSKPKSAATVVIPGGKIYLPLEGIIDLDAERGRLRKELEKAEGYVAAQEKKLSNERFVQNAPEDVVRGEREKLESQRDKAAKLAAALGDLG